MIGFEPSSRGAGVAGPARTRPQPAGRRRRARARLSGVLLVLCAAALWCDAHPIHLPTRQPQGGAAFPRRATDHPVLLAVRWETYKGRAPRTPAQRAADLEWSNVLTQAFGGCDVLATEEVGRDIDAALQNRAVLVLPRRTLAGLDAGWVSALRPHVSQGLVVVLEAPPPLWAKEMGLDLQGEEVVPELTWAPAPRLRAPTLDVPLPDPPPLPLPVRVSRYAPAASARALARPILDMGGRPALWRLDEGAGAWLICALDVGDLALSIRQGVPDPGFHLPDRYAGVLAGPGETNDLVATRSLLQADAPWLDAWIAALFDAELAPAPWASVWPAPLARDGWVLLTHDDDGWRDTSRWMTRAQAGRGAPSTLYLMAPDARLTVEGEGGPLADGAEIGLQARLPVGATWKDERSPRRRIGAWRFQPLAQLPSIVEQREGLVARLPAGTPLTLNRNHSLLWPDDVDRGWRWLVGAGFRGDSSYGPDHGAAGWLFGSAVPFRPIDRRGLAYPLWEVPFLWGDTDGGVDRARVDRWLRTNAVGGHGPVALLFHPDVFGETPSAELFRMWDALPELAQRRNHQLATMTALLDFWELRAQAHVRWVYGGGLLRVHVEAPAGAAQAGLAVALPLHWRRLTLTSWEASWQPAESRRSSSFGRELRLVALPQGAGELSANYR
jgi:hypothetical protein